MNAVVNFINANKKTLGVIGGSVLAAAIGKVGYDKLIGNKKTESTDEAEYVDVKFTEAE